MKDNGRKIRDMGRVFIDTRMEMFMKEIGKMMKKKGLEFTGFKMVILMKDSSI